MKFFKIEKSFSPGSRKDLVLDAGEYPIVEWFNNGFIIKIFEHLSMKENFVSISPNELKENGKIVVKIEVTK